MQSSLLKRETKWDQNEKHCIDGSLYIEKIHPTAMLLPAQWEVTKTPAKEDEWMEGVEGYELWIVFHLMALKVIEAPV